MTLLMSALMDKYPILFDNLQTLQTLYEACGEAMPPPTVFTSDQIHRACAISKSIVAGLSAPDQQRLIEHDQHVTNEVADKLADELHDQLNLSQPDVADLLRQLPTEGCMRTE